MTDVPPSIEMTDWITYDKYPPEPARKAVCEWLRRHGVDPNNVPLPGWIGRNEDTYQVVYLSFGVRDDPDGDWLECKAEDIVEVPRVVQLGGKPLPFPAEFYGATR